MPPPDLNAPLPPLPVWRRLFERELNTEFGGNGARNRPNSWVTVEVQGFDGIEEPPFETLHSRGVRNHFGRKCLASCVIASILLAFVVAAVAIGTNPSPPQGVVTGPVVGPPTNTTASLTSSSGAMTTYTKTSFSFSYDPVTTSTILLTTTIEKTTTVAIATLTTLTTIVEKREVYSPTTMAMPTSLTPSQTFSTQTQPVNAPSTFTTMPPLDLEEASNNQNTCPALTPFDEITAPSYTRSKRDHRFIEGSKPLMPKRYALALFGLMLLASVVAICVIPWKIVTYTKWAQEQGKEDGGNHSGSEVPVKG